MWLNLNQKLMQQLCSKLVYFVLIIITHAVLTVMYRLTQLVVVQYYFEVVVVL